MLTQLPTVKRRLGLDLLDPTWDTLLLEVIARISARFDGETNRQLGRSENAVFEFAAEDNQILVPCYPIESILKFQTKVNEADGWLDQVVTDYIVRNGCIISLGTSLAELHAQAGTAGARPVLSRVFYIGGYVLPGGQVPPGATPLPADLEHAAIEQTAFWFQTKDAAGVLRQWPRTGSYVQFADADLLPSVREILGRYTRIVW